MSSARKHFLSSTIYLALDNKNENSLLLRNEKSVKKVSDTLRKDSTARAAVET